MPLLFQVVLCVSGTTGLLRILVAELPSLRFFSIANFLVFVCPTAEFKFSYQRVVLQETNNKIFCSQHEIFVKMTREFPLRIYIFLTVRTTSHLASFSGLIFDAKLNPGS